MNVCLTLLTLVKQVKQKVQPIKNHHPSLSLAYFIPSEVHAGTRSIELLSSEFGKNDSMKGTTGHVDTQKLIFVIYLALSSLKLQIKELDMW